MLNIADRVLVNLSTDVKAMVFVTVVFAVLYFMENHKHAS